MGQGDTGTDKKKGEDKDFNERGGLINRWKAGEK